jgi:DNA-binding response OmpR family regulator
VEDERSIRQGLTDVLTFRGYVVVAVESGRAALDEMAASGFDVVVLDIMLPEIDGYRVCRQLREAGQQTPVLMLTAKGSEEDILAGFEAGADDYVTKPFSVRELLARVQALLKRQRNTQNDRFRAGPLEVRPDRGVARHGDEEIELSAREVAILRILTEDPGRIVSRRTLLREAWNMRNADHVETRTVDVHVAKLRKKLGAHGAHLLETVRGQGYRWGCSDI